MLFHTYSIQSTIYTEWIGQHTRHEISINLYCCCVICISDRQFTITYCLNAYKENMMVLHHRTPVPRIYHLASQIMPQCEKRHVAWILEMKKIRLSCYCDIQHAINFSIMSTFWIWTGKTLIQFTIHRLYDVRPLLNNKHFWNSCLQNVGHFFRPQCILC